MSDDLSLLHGVESIVDLCQGTSGVDVFVNLELAVEPVVDDARELGASLYATEGRSLPFAASDELEWSGRDLLSGSSDTDDGAYTPSLVARLESLSHDLYVACAVKSIVETTIGHLDELFNNLAIWNILWVDKVGRSHVTSPLFLVWVHVDGNDLAGFASGSTLNDSETNAA